MSTDTLVAEALAAAERETPCETRGACRYAALPTEHLESEACDGEFDDVGWMGTHALARDNVGAVPMARLDVVDAALRHLAERVERLRAGLASFGVDPLGWEPSVLAATILSDDASGGRSDLTCESWQERATRAEAALMRIVEIGDGVGLDVAAAALRAAGLLDAEETDDG